MCSRNHVKHSIFVSTIIIIAVCRFAVAIQHDHVLYNMKGSIGVASCCRHSPEIFFHDVALPSLSIVYLRSKAFFGILMDQIESSAITDFQEESKNRTAEQLEFITNTVSTSLDIAIDHVETSWRYFIATYETPPLPWEIPYKFIVLNEALNRLEYSYMMVDAVVRSGTKEIVGMLQHQLANVIRQLDEEVSKDSDLKGGAIGKKIFKQMKRVLAKMKRSFATRLLEKVVEIALGKFNSSHRSKPVQPNIKQTTFISEALDQLAILFHAFREKGSIYPNFWQDLSKIFLKEFMVGDTNPGEDENEVVSKFMRNISNQDVLINLVIQFISRDTQSYSKP